MCIHAPIKNNTTRKSDEWSIPLRNVIKDKDKNGKIIYCLVYYIYEEEIHMKEKTGVSIIGGSDGPTSIFIAGRTGKISLKEKIRRQINQYKRKKAASGINPGTHTLEEVISYAQKEYGATEISKQSTSYVEQRKCLKESLIISHKPELLGDLKDIPKLQEYTEEAIKERQHYFELRSELAARTPDEQMPMDFHIYEILFDGGNVEIQIEYNWNIFGCSYSGNKKAIKQVKKSCKELYLYYGVTKEDIQNNTQRYAALVTMLSI